MNCTIGPSSDTTWFPTWIKGILPTERQKKHTHRSRPLKNAVTFEGEIPRNSKDSSEYVLESYPVKTALSFKYWDVHGGHDTDFKIKDNLNSRGG